MNTEAFLTIFLEAEFFVYVLLLYILVGLLGLLLDKNGIKYTKKIAVLLDVLMFVGALFISFVFFRHDEPYSKYVFPFVFFIFLIRDTYLAIRKKSYYELDQEAAKKYWEEKKKKIGGI